MCASGSGARGESPPRRCGGTALLCQQAPVSARSSVLGRSFGWFAQERSSLARSAIIAVRSSDAGARQARVLAGGGERGVGARLKVRELRGRLRWARSMPRRRAGRASKSIRGEQSRGWGARGRYGWAGADAADASDADELGSRQAGQTRSETDIELTWHSGSMPTLIVARQRTHRAMAFDLVIFA